MKFIEFHLQGRPRLFRIANIQVVAPWKNYEKIEVSQVYMVGEESPWEVDEDYEKVKRLLHLED